MEHRDGHLGLGALPAVHAHLQGHGEAGTHCGSFRGVFPPRISHNRTVYSWSNMPCWHQGCFSPAGLGVCRLEAVVAISNGLRAPSALPFSSQAFSWSDSFHVKEAQSFRHRSSGVLTYLTPDGTAPLRKQPGTPEI